MTERLRDHWEHYERFGLANLNEFETAEHQATFFAGALSLLQILQRAVKRNDDDTQIRALIAECNTYVDAMVNLLEQAEPRQ